MPRDMRDEDKSLKTQVRFGDYNVELYQKSKGSDSPYKIGPQWKTLREKRKYRNMITQSNGRGSLTIHQGGKSHRQDSLQFFHPSGRKTSNNHEHSEDVTPDTPAKKSRRNNISGKSSNAETMTM